MRHAFELFCALLLVGLLGGCEGFSSETDAGGAKVGGPGNKPWSDDVGCSVDGDCAQGEVCDQGVCQMARCANPYDSSAPLGQNRYFGTDGEFVVVSDDSYVDGFEPDDGSYVSSWDLAGATVVDVAGGNLTGSRPHAIAVALQYDDKLRVRDGNGERQLSIGIWPAALAAGDIDLDGLDELVALGDDGSLSVCQVDEGVCTVYTLPGAVGKDIAVADVDGDGFAEPLLLVEVGDESQVLVWNTDTALTGDEELAGWTFSFPVKALSAGDLDGDRMAEVVVLEDRGWFGFADDRMHVFSAKTGKFTASEDVDGATRDLAVGDRDSDGRAEIGILREDHVFELFSGSLDSLSEWNLSVGGEATRLSVLDWNGDSASGRLINGPELVSGEIVPLAVLVLPPYPRHITKEVASLSLGNSESTSEELSDTVSLTIGVMVAFGADLGSVVKAQVGASLETTSSYTTSFSKSMSIGQRFDVLADPATFGTDYGAVVLSCGCFHRYSYRTEDPAQKLGPDGERFDIFIPVGGQTALWSTKRYNAMARALGTFPVIDIPYTVGDPASYPQQLQTLTGQPIPEQDMLFRDVPTFTVSDVGTVGFSLEVGESETNSVAESVDIGASGTIGGGGVEVTISGGIGFSTGYSISVGKSAYFYGSVPPIPDDPATPEDEYELYRYAFSPAVYRQAYTNAAGEQAGYYVMTYAVGR